MRKKSISAVVAVLVVGLLVVAGFYFQRRARGVTGPETALSLAAPAGELPEGWYISSYEEAYAAYSNEAGVLTITSQVPDDVRLCKQISVQENTCYVFSAQIATEGVAGGRGASLSIDNYGIDKSCVYSDSLYDTNDFTEVNLYFQTRPEQTQIILALRLGGYSEDSSGTVHFSHVSLREGAAEEAVYQVLEPWGGGEESDGDDAFRNEEHYKAFFAVIVWAAVLAGVMLLFGIYRNRRLLTEKNLTEKGFRSSCLFILGVGLALRIILCALFRGHDSDMGCFIAWGQDIAAHGTRTFYWAAGHEWYDYPPGYMLFLGGYSWLLNLIKVNTGAVWGIFLYMLPAVVADGALAMLLMRFARRQNLNNAGALILGGLVFLNPALLFLSGAWGQIDSILTLFLVLSFLSLQEDKRILSGALFGLAVMIKWQALMFGPVYAFAHLVSIPWKKREAGRSLRDTALGALAAVAVMVVIGLPFKGEQGVFWFVSKFLSASSGYDYATVEAYNYFALCGANWRRANEYMLPNLITYKQFGTCAILLAVFCGGMVLRQRRKQQGNNPSLKEDKGAVYLAASLTMALIFTFGHYMHERYIVPVLVLLLFAYAYDQDKRLLLATLLFTVTTFLNEMMAMYVVSSGAMDVIRGGREHNTVLRFWSGVEVVVCLYFVYVTVDMLHHIKDKLGQKFAGPGKTRKSPLYTFLEEGLKK